MVAGMNVEGSKVEVLLAPKPFAAGPSPGNEAEKASRPTDGVTDEVDAADNGGSLATSGAR